MEDKIKNKVKDKQDIKHDKPEKKLKLKSELKKEVLITIKGTQKIDGERDVVELMTTGRFYRKNNMYYLAYEETEATGFGGSRTTVKVGPNKKVTMTRFGTSRSQLVVENGVRHQCLYNTGYGTMTIGVMGQSFDNELTDAGGKLEFGYSLDIDVSIASENYVQINIKECAPASQQAHKIQPKLLEVPI